MERSRSRSNEKILRDQESFSQPRFRRLFVLSLFGASVFLLISLWLNAAWIYGSLYRQAERAQYLDVVVIDLDGSDIGRVISAGAASISASSGVVTFRQMDDMNFDSAHHAVWRGGIWGALIAMPNATANLNLAISTGDSSYDPSQAVTYIWNEARWALAEESIVLSSIEAAVTQAQAQYAQEYASKRLSTSTISRNSTLNAMNPIQATALNLYSFSIGIKPFINTVGFVFPGLIQFFFAMALGGISAKTHIHRLSPVRSYLIRFIISRIWTFMIAISWAGWFYTFAEGRTGAASSYILMALDMWMYTMISFEFHDSCAAFIPIEFLPITVLSWVIINVTAAAFPIALKPVFYHIDYAIPSFNCFEIFVTILTGGAANRLYRNLPVLFAWMIIAGAVGVAANLKRCHLAQVTARKYEKHDITSDLGNGEGITKPADQKEDTVENMFSREALG